MFGSAKSTEIWFYLASIPKVERMVSTLYIQKNYV